MFFKVLLKCGQFATYQAVSTKPEWPEEGTSRLNTLALRFAKVASRYFEPRQNDLTEKSVLLEQRKTLRTFIPFTTSPTPNETLSGVFFTGDQPCWILATAKAGVQIHSCSYGTVNSFTTCSMWDSKGDFLLYTDEVILLGGLLVACLSWFRARAYSSGCPMSILERSCLLGSFRCKEAIQVWRLMLLRV